MIPLDLEQNFCPNQNCPDYGKKGFGNLAGYGTYGPKQTRLLYCRTCRTRFSERRNTVFFGLHTDEDTIERVIRSLAAGHSIRTTAKLMGINKDTVHRIYERAGQHCQQILRNLLKDVYLENYPLEGLWRLLEKKRKADGDEPERTEANRILRLTKLGTTAGYNLKERDQKI